MWGLMTSRLPLLISADPGIGVGDPQVPQELPSSDLSTGSGAQPRSEESVLCRNL